MNLRLSKCQGIVCCDIWWIPTEKAINNKKWLSYSLSYRSAGSWEAECGGLLRRGIALLSFACATQDLIAEEEVVVVGLVNGITAGSVCFLIKRKLQGVIQKMRPIREKQKKRTGGGVQE